MARTPIILAVDDTPANLIALEAVLDRDFDLRCVREPKRIEAELQGRITRLVSLGVELEQSMRQPEPS